MLRAGRRATLLTMTVALLAPVFAAGPAQAVPADAFVPPSAEQIAAEEDYLFQLLNQARAAAGVPAVVRNAVLDRHADEWTAYMIAGNCPPRYFPLCHRTNLKQIANEAAAPNKAKWWSENVQRTNGTLEYGHSRLLLSPGHRANMLRAKTNRVGIGIAYHPETGARFVTYEFAEVDIPPHRCGRVTSTLVKGSRGSQVKVLQCALADLGLYTGVIDGRFRDSTKAAVAAFQTSRGIKATGKATLVTRRALSVTA